MQKADYRNAMSRLGAAVNIITTDGPAGRAGFTASAVCSVTDEPPTLLICLNRTASVYPAFEANGVLCVNVLAPGHQALSGVFGGKTPMDERFAAGRWHEGVTGSPMLDGAAVSFDCRVVRSTAVGTHDGSSARWPRSPSATRRTGSSTSIGATTTSWLRHTERLNA